MSRLPPLPLSALPAELVAAIGRGLDSRVLSTALPLQVWAHRPEVALAWLNTLQVLHDTALLSERERELVRLRIAAFTRCEACQLARKSATVTAADIACLSPDSDLFTAREQAALRFAGQLALDHTAIDDSHFTELAAVFSAAEIAELHLFCGLMLAGGRITYTLQAYPDSVSAEPPAVSAYPAAAPVADTASNSIPAAAP
jgi:alkylhydroperoxidase family enzyme